MDFKSIDSPVDSKLLIAFCDLTNYAKVCQRKSSREIFEMMSHYFELSGDVIEQAEGEIVKFIGDAIFIIFPDYHVKKGIQALRDLKKKVDVFFKNEGLECVLHVKAHIGSVTCGRIGTKSNKHFDVFGHEVNVAALLPRGDFVLSSKLEETVTH